MLTTLPGMGPQSLDAIRDMRGAAEEEDLPIVNDNQDDAMEWENVPNNLEDNEVFVQAARDLMDDR